LRKKKHRWRGIAGVYFDTMAMFPNTEAKASWSTGTARTCYAKYMKMFKYMIANGYINNGTVIAWTNVENNRGKKAFTHSVAEFNRELTKLLTACGIATKCIKSYSYRQPGKGLNMAFNIFKCVM